MSTKISQLTSAVDVTANDLIQIVDVEDGVMAPSGTNKKATASLLAKELAKQPLEPGVVISGSSSSDAVRITQTGAGNALVVEDSTNPDSTPFVVSNIGRVGIGIQQPQGSLDVQGSAVFRGSVAGETSGYVFFAPKAGTDAFGANFDRFEIYVDPSSQQTLIGNTHGGTGLPRSLAFNAGNAERMRIDSAGNVGIGTSSPSAKLHVSIDAAAGGIGILSKNTSTAHHAGATQALVGPSTTSSRITHYNVNLSGSEGSFAIQKGDSTGGFAATIADYLYSSDIWRFFTAGVERMRIDSTGKVGIGTANPSYQFELSTDSAAKPSTSTWTVSSDERLKENIEAADLDICYNAVKSIPLKRYKWKDEIYSAEQVADRSKIGWIAQDVQAVFPKAVGQHKFVYNQVKDEEGNIVSEDSIDDCLSLNSDQLYAALFGAVQKLMGEVESLQDRIAELESAP